MKKYIWWGAVSMKYWIIGLVAVLILIILGAFALSIFGAFDTKVDMSFATDGVAVFNYENKDISESMTADDFSVLCNLFNGKKLYSDNPSCGFTEDVSVSVNNTESFCFACDSCHIVYWKNKNKYFRLSKNEYDILMEILNKYGFVFPCI